jgi:mono/diheme cytochrome c family protein
VPRGMKIAREHDMIISYVKWLMIAGLTAVFAAAAQAEDFDAGKAEFQSSCASCHGADGKGKDLPASSSRCRLPI